MIFVANTIDPQAGAADADAAAESVALQRVDEVGASLYPADLGDLHVAAEYQLLADEQITSFLALGIETQREADLTTAGLAQAADTQAELVRGQTALVDDARERFIAIVTALTPFVRRPPKAIWPHYATKAGLFLGEGLGLFAALLWLGEVEWVAVVMGISVATATLTAGLSGAEVKDLRMRALRQRPLTDLPDHLRDWAHLFAGPQAGGSHVKALLYVSVTVALTLAVTIGMLRGVVDEPIVGLVFGALGIAVSAASWLDSYAFADEIADLIARARRTLAQEEHRLIALTIHPTWKEWARARAEAGSLTREYEARGKAASQHMHALLARILRNNPAVAGNGRRAEPTAIGQTTRRSGGAK